MGKFPIFRYILAAGIMVVGVFAFAVALKGFVLVPRINLGVSPQVETEGVGAQTTAKPPALDDSYVSKIATLDTLGGMSQATDSVLALGASELRVLNDTKNITDQFYGEILSGYPGGLENALNNTDESILLNDEQKKHIELQIDNLLNELDEASMGLYQELKPIISYDNGTEAKKKYISIIEKINPFTEEEFKKLAGQFGDLSSDDSVQLLKKIIIGYDESIEQVLATPTPSDWYELVSSGIQALKDQRDSLVILSLSGREPFYYQVAMERFAVSVTSYGDASRAFQDQLKSEGML